MISEDGVDNQSMIIWVLLEQNYVGANNQCITLANHLGLQYECKTLVFDKEVILSKSDFLHGSLKQLNKEQSSSLLSPWPDLIVVPTKACEQIALWIKKASQEKSMLVRLGKVKTPVDLWDLIISPKQYCFPKRKNILCTNLPLRDINNELIQQEILQWRPEINHLPEPYFALFLGGPIKHFPYTEEKAKKLAELLNRKFSGQGSLLISSSRRTPGSFYECLIKNLKLPYYSYSWDANSTQNPYFAFLGMSKEVIIAGDSITMLAEAVITGKFIHIYYHRRPWFYSLGMQIAKGLVLFLGSVTKFAIGIRDDRRFYRYLISQKKGTRLQEGSTKEIFIKTVRNEDLDNAVRHVRQLLVPKN
ncbi:ELM1/GtrOC1 family putative glycosyltransferase [Legionella pneumophila]|uniref:ELM1/GtrOC1 family putative glycosyltransferase n=1 Tax=Legionella pneumophila TaxID=446 RepID=UPI0007787146|nr:ELM1/GtrOC1 family putative glycosyltransferase [Legionella pneumophila]HAT8606381.1 hypothetical protein [Legionella pneumophila]